LATEQNAQLVIQPHTVKHMANNNCRLTRKLCCFKETMQCRVLVITTEFE